MKVGDGLVEGNQIGPLNNKPQFERVTELVEDAKKHGAKIMTGGARLGSEGYFYQPTIVGNISDGVRLVDEEQFGPALPIIAYKDVDDAVRRANSTKYGLQRLGMVERHEQGGRGRRAARNRIGMGQSASGDRAQSAVRRREVVGNRCRERAMGSARVYRNTGREFRQNVGTRRASHRLKTLGALHI